MPVLSKYHFFYFPTVSRAVKYRKYRRRTWNKWPFLGLNLIISASILLPSIQRCSVYIYVVISSVAPVFHLCSLVGPSPMCYTCVCPLTS